MSTHNIPFSRRKKENTLNYNKSAAMFFFSSPEPKAPGELIVRQALSSVRLSSVHNFKGLLL